MKLMLEKGPLCCRTLTHYTPANFVCGGFTVFIIPPQTLFVVGILFSRCLSVRLCARTCPRYIMRFAICTAVLSEVRVRLGLVQYGVMGLKWACGVNFTRLTPSICNG